MDVSAFALVHIPQISATIGLVTFALARNKLTPAGILAAIAVAIIHMTSPYSVFFWLLVPFFLLGVLVTKIGHEAKARLTQSSIGSSGGEGARSAVQVFCNAGGACILIALHAWLATSSPFMSLRGGVVPGIYAPKLQRVLPVGIMAHYAAVAADTFGSELGILAKSSPVLITAPWKKVPKGTNGGVTIEGLAFGLLASFLITVIAQIGVMTSQPFRALDTSTGLLVIGAGVAGSLLDSFLGATVQATVTDKGSGKVVEGPGGQRVKVLEGGSRVQLGRDILTNNGVNFTMAALTSVGAMAVAFALDLGL
nr:hypothetical protein B0A51_15957 [Rachicladosporium sp. CCFEE 5018]